MCPQTTSRHLLLRPDVGNGGTPLLWAPLHGRNIQPQENHNGSEHTGCLPKHGGKAGLYLPSTALQSQGMQRMGYI